MTSRSRQTGNPTLSASLRDYSRAAAGGLVLGTPLLFTMEVWFHGFLMPWWKILLLLAVSFGIVIAYSAVAGFRDEGTVTELVLDSVATIGLGVVLAFIALLALGRIEPGNTTLRDAAGMVALETIPIAFGASVASAEFGGGPGSRNRQPHALARLFVGAGGALLLALNVAPTEEVIMLGLRASPWVLLALVAATLLATLWLVFYADFAGKRGNSSRDVLDHPVTETLTGYAVSLVVAYLLVWSFGWSDGADLLTTIGMTIALGGVAAIGAAVARLIVSGGKEEDAPAK